jgi:hypothetical protein
VTDIRLANPHTGAIDHGNVARLAADLRDRDVLLSVGLGRPWARGNGARRHWLQINNIHLL